VYISKNQLVNLLKQTGIEIRGNKVNKTDLRHIFGAKYKEPEWMLLSDYHLDTPQIYLNFIEREEGKLGRAILSATYSIANFGEFATAKGNQGTLIGILYQYSLKGNPRNVHYAYRLFMGSKHIAKNSGFTSLDEAKNECAHDAKNLIETQLFDLT